MTDPRLPPGVTAQDIDDHFGGDPDEAYVTLNVVVDVPARGYDDDQLVSDARETVSDELCNLDGDLIEMYVDNIERR